MVRQSGPSARAEDRVLNPLRTFADLAEIEAPAIGREELRQRNYLPIIFDFQPPDSRDLTETILTLAAMSRFVIVDLTEPKSAPHELATVVPHLRSVPVQAICQSSDSLYAMTVSPSWHGGGASCSPNESSYVADNWLQGRRVLGIDA